MTLNDYLFVRNKFLEINLRYFDDDIESLENHPLQETLLRLFKYLSGSLKRYSNAVGLKETFFLYHTARTPNAGADSRHSECNLIFIHNGLMHKLHEHLFMAKHDYENIVYGEFKYIHNNLPDSIESIMFEAGLIFVFYHEFAHLVQNHGAINYFEEVNKIEYDKYQHIKEFDSDLLGCNFVLNHIWQYGNDLPQITKNTDAKIKLFWVGLSSIIITMVLFMNNFYSQVSGREFYLRDKKHPHESVRIHYIMQHYIFNMNKTFGLEVTIVDGLAYCLRFCSEYFKGTDFYSFYSKILTENIDVLNEYCDELFDLSTKYPMMSRHFVDKLR